MNIEQAAALNRLIRVAQHDSGQARKVAAFLLAWWNAETCGGFDLTDLGAVDAAIVKDMFTVMQLITEVNLYPDSLGYRRPFEDLVREWRPHLIHE
ncbi:MULTISPECIES: DUF7673 family protein [Pseudoxanthomonas]|uniref:DUF7673 family protein n=1 Tax=Pseudoxanthomonas TaxID=83618 RepID=UPI0022F3C0FF|nr:hypothetical protein [Pseudoxanthomonas mexicana]WBX95049.1 hypothetical protein PE064_07650 [Pseudoxanthomonas mexicana]